MRDRLRWPFGLLAVATTSLPLLCIPAGAATQTAARKDRPGLSAAAAKQIQELAPSLPSRDRSIRGRDPDGTAKIRERLENALGPILGAGSATSESDAAHQADAGGPSSASTGPG